jgi:hypothetical protein
MLLLADWAEAPDEDQRAALAAWVAHVLPVIEGWTDAPNVVTLVRAG